MSSSVKNSFNQMVTVDDDSTIQRSNLSATLSSYTSNGSYMTSSTTSSNSTYHRTPREVLEDFIDSFKSFDYSTLPPVYNNISDQESHLQVNPANPNFDYSRFTQLERDALITSCSLYQKDYVQGI